MEYNSIISVYLCKKTKRMKTKVWPFSIRIFHWLLAIGFASAYILGEDHDLRKYHIAFGLMVGCLILFRLLYGVFGPKYARFGDFPIGLKHQMGFIRSFFRKSVNYIGHNPLAAITMLAILIVGLLTSLSGFLLYGGEHGILNVQINEHSLEEGHEVLANLFLALVVFHLAGLLVETLIHKNIGTLSSMFSGNKNLEGESIKENIFQRFYGLIWIFIPIIIFILSLKLNSGAGSDTDHEHEREHYEHHDDDD